MTGYGRSQLLVDGMNITVEVKSVNHRYFEFSSRLPRSYGFLDEKLKSFFMGKLTRGKMECYVQIETVEEPDTIISVNHPLVKGYLDAYNELAETYGLENNIRVSDISRVSDIFSIRKQAADEDKIWAAVQTVADEALNGTTALNAFALMMGANILRVHDVKAATEVVKLYSLLSSHD